MVRTSLVWEAQYTTFLLRQKKKIGAEIYFSNDKEMFERFRAHSEEIEQELGVKAEWRTATKDCRILILNDGDAKKGPDAWSTYFDWFCDIGVRLLPFLNAAVQFEIWCRLQK